MESTVLADRLAAMTDPRPTISERFAALDRRREEDGVSIDRLSKAAGFKSIQSWYDVRDGKRPEATLAKFERALEYIEEHAEHAAVVESQVAPSTTEGLIEFEVTGDFGVRVVVRGPVSNAEELERAAAKIIRDIRGAQESNHGSD